MSRNDSEKWYRQSGPEGDVVISTRVRLARNLPNFPFPGDMSLEQRREVVRLATQAVQDTTSAVGPLTSMDVQDLPEREVLSMAERHLISPEFCQRQPGSLLLLNEEESAVVMVNEEDHFRIQVMRPGLQLDETYRAADDLDTALDAKLHFAFDDKLGYLTQCPTNLGTGMRASIMLHLPALQEKGMLQQIANTVSKLGLTIRGLYGEGSKSEGAIYQLSNQVTLGISEQAAIENLKGIALQIIREERALREQYCRNPRFEDRVWRSLGILSTARLLSGDEFMSLISNLRVGVAMQMIHTLSLDVISGLINDAQPATIMAANGQDLEPGQRDTLRARLVRERLAPAMGG